MNPFPGEPGQCLWGQNLVLISNLKIPKLPDLCGLGQGLSLMSHRSNSDQSGSLAATGSAGRSRPASGVASWTRRGHGITEAGKDLGDCGVQPFQALPRAPRIRVSRCHIRRDSSPPRALGGPSCARLDTRSSLAKTGKRERGPGQVWECPRRVRAGNAPRNPEPGMKCPELLEQGTCWAQRVPSGAGAAARNRRSSVGKPSGFSCL